MTLKSEWEEYRKAVVSPNAGEAQIKDLKNTFYAGALTVSRVVAFAPEELKNIEVELVDFLKEIEDEQ